jgi:hypothetical protein
MSTYTQILYQIVFGSYDYTPFLTIENENIRYVEIQREHHKVFSFKEELTELLKEHSVDYNEDYLIT